MTKSPDFVGLFFGLDQTKLRLNRLRKKKPAFILPKTDPGLEIDHLNV
jgi:hypothetical protein